MERDDKLLDIEENKILLNKELNKATKEDNDDDDADDDTRRTANDDTSRYLDAKTILSPELLSQTDSVMVSGRKKQKTKSKEVELTPSEIRDAKKESKRMKRKLKQLSDRRSKKEARTSVYSTLEANKLTEEQYGLMSSSSKLGHTLTKKERLKRYLDLERAGIKLTEDQRSELYVEREDISEEEKEEEGKAIDSDMLKKAEEMMSQENGPSFRVSKKKRKAMRKEKMGDEPDKKKEWVGIWKEKGEKSEDSTDDEKDAPAPPPPPPPPTALPTPPTTLSFAEQMMAQLGSLKKKTLEDAPKLEKQRQESAELAQQKEEDRIAVLLKDKNTDYKPALTVQLKSAAALNITSDHGLSARDLPTIERPLEVQASRLNLPVCGMEQEIVEAIKQNDVLILCGETGSGKSTQLPQFIYESVTSVHTKNLIGVTQPRRVAAVSTAKRVAYEMGVGDGTSIKRDNLVAYQTRYESAGLGEKTRVKFMTDGILLQEVREDLLLRRYNVVVLDEAHERSLNTDVLLGLLSGTVSLRRKNADSETSSLPPLKLIIMSATLRVTDFTENSRLFSNQTNLPVLRVPGRTHPVTIHHSKDTELEDYVGEAITKAVKIHKKLPGGGILIFLTGRDEILFAVKRLRRILEPRRNKTISRNDKLASEAAEQEIKSKAGELNEVRDKDDDEEDANAFATGILDSDDDESSGDESDSDEDEDGFRASNPVHILPLYSMLSADEQAKVFAPPPENHRLIVVATNIAETSITIPGISYVVDSGREKSRNYNENTGIASYEVAWISKAAADQRAGRAGRTGPGHCYRIYSSSVYTRLFPQFAEPEMVTKPVEDVVLAMKSMGIDHVTDFPFPTPPNLSQLTAALRMLNHLSCLKKSGRELEDEEGEITDLGRALARLPLSVRSAKMLLAGVGSGMLDLAILLVSCMSEQSPFVDGPLLVKKKKEGENEDEDGDNVDEGEKLDEIDKAAEEKAKLEEEDNEKNALREKWKHVYGDAIARVLAAGAFHHAGKGAGGVTEENACKAFCDANGLNATVLQRVQKLRMQLTRVVGMRLGTAAKKGSSLEILPPPTKVQQLKLCQLLCSGLLDNIARRATGGEVVGENGIVRRDAYISCSGSREPLYLSARCALYDRQWKNLPEYVCFESILMRTRAGKEVAIMDNVARVEPAWLPALAKGSPLLKLGKVAAAPTPDYDKATDEIVCYVESSYGEGGDGWALPPSRANMRRVLNAPNFKDGLGAQAGDNFVWFARKLLEGGVFEDLAPLAGEKLLNCEPREITLKKPKKQILNFVNRLKDLGVDTKEALKGVLAKDDKFLWAEAKSWCSKDGAKRTRFKAVWGSMVKKAIL
ncbi:hypothetical protein TrST_g10959 [Triparma strigata]|uniref:RNA helicase n=1 Tax=Triparma strigata TaxID=1606541 RepID=A0A9W7BUU4_9STRA|nr:hypothetical protein TrST_g10959 [Triparma strigata]